MWTLIQTGLRNLGSISQDCPSVNEMSIKFITWYSSGPRPGRHLQLPMVFMVGRTISEQGNHFNCYLCCVWISSLFKPWIGRKRPWTWFHLFSSSVYFNCFSNLTFQDDYWQTVKKVCRPKATVPGYAVRRWPGSKNHNVSMTGKAGEAEGSPRLMITSTHTRTTKKKVKKVTEWGCRFKGKQSDRQFGN